MTKLILASHGKLSEGMAYSAQMIAGESENLSWYGLMPGGSVDEDIIGKIRAQVEAEPENTFLVLSDLDSGSVCNASYTLQSEPNVLLATGMNLSLVVDLLSNLDEEYDAERFVEAVAESRGYTRVLERLDAQAPDSVEDFF